MLRPVRESTGTAISQLKPPPTNVELSALAMRPGFGTTGDESKIDTNHWNLDMGKVGEIYLHSVSINPTVRERSTRTGVKNTT